MTGVEGMTAAKLLVCLGVCFAAIGLASWLLRMRLLAEGGDPDAIRGGLWRLWVGAVCILGLLVGAGVLAQFDIRTLTSLTAPPVIAMALLAGVIAVIVRRSIMRMLEGP